MRVLHLIPSMTVGGAERQLALLASELSHLGIEAHIGFIHGGVNLGLLRDSRARLHAIPCIGNHDPLIIVRILELIRAVRPNILQTWLTQMDVLGGMAAIMAGVPFVLSERSNALAYPLTWKHRLRLWVGKRASAIVANSELGAKYWNTHEKSETIVIHNGLPLQAMRDISPADPLALDLSRDSELILFAGRLSQEKNVPTVVNAIDEVLASRTNCAAVLFGEGPLQSAVEEAVARALARDRIRFNKFTGEIWHWMRRASVFVSLSYFEGHPNAVLEAMALGCPVVVSRIPPHEAILNDTTALFCDPGSAADAAQAIRMTLDDPVAAGARADAARKRSAMWSIEKTSNQYLRLYEKLTLANRNVA